MIIEKTKFRALNESDPQVVDKERGHGLQKKIRLIIIINQRGGGCRGVEKKDIMNSKTTF